MNPAKIWGHLSYSLAWQVDRVIRQQTQNALEPVYETSKGTRSALWFTVEDGR